ncbi:hypothetical protein TNCV_1218861 [Trichonephila clavipes]|nr:hypothetical protein TNCV_1218861 [Trichonephila clavipes]
MCVFQVSSGEGMDASEYIVPLRHGGTLNRCQAVPPLVRLVEGEERWEVLSIPQNWGGQLTPAVASATADGLALEGASQCF